MDPSVVVLGHNALQVTMLVKDFDVDAVRISVGSELSRYPDTLVLLICVKTPIVGVHDVSQAREFGFRGRIIVLSDQAIDPTTEAALYYSGADNCLFTSDMSILLMPLVKMSLRLWQHTIKRKLLHAGNLTIDTEGVVVTVGKKRIEVTRTEFEILRLVISRLGNVISRQTIMDEVLGNKYVNDRSIDSHFKRMRKRLTAAGVEGFTIQTEYGFGYRGVIT